MCLTKAYKNMIKLKVDRYHFFWYFDTKYKTENLLILIPIPIPIPIPIHISILGNTYPFHEYYAAKLNPQGEAIIVHLLISK